MPSMRRVREIWSSRVHRRIVESNYQGTRMRAVIITLIVAVVFTSLGCDAIFNNGCPDDTECWNEYQLYMGRGASEGEVVDDSEWDAFLADAVTPRFPDGLTVLDGMEQWRGSDNIIQKETTKVLITLASDNDEDAKDLIAEEYKQRFNQESVLKTVNKTCIAF